MSPRTGFRDVPQLDDAFTTVPLRGDNLSAGLYLVTLPENLEMPTVAAFAAVAK